MADTDLPPDHHSNFPSGWWNERRKRDYYVDNAGCVKLRLDSPTADKLFGTLIMQADQIAASLVVKH